MARKSKNAKKTEENSNSEPNEALKAVEAGPSETEAEPESKLTEEASEEGETTSPPESDAEPADAALVSDTAEEVTVEEQPGETSAEDDGEAPDDETDSEETPVETSVAGVVPAQSEGAEAAPPPPAPPPPAAAPSAFPLVLGGLLAGAAGFLIATFAVPEGWPNPPAETSAIDPEIAATIEALTGEVAALSDRLEALPEPVSGEAVDLAPLIARIEAAEGGAVDLAPLVSRIEAIEGETSGVQSALAALEQSSVDLAARIQEIAERPNIVSPDGSAAMEAQLETFRRDLDAVTQAARAEIEEVQSRASQIEAEAAAAAEAASRNAAIAEVRASLEDGSPFAESLSVLGDSPEALSAVASDGVAPLATLQDEFPNAARETLRETQTVANDASTTDRLTSFFRRHTNARSLTPREGDDVDAILSRAEAALTEGDVAGALTELDALPESAAATMQDWMTAARARADAVDAMNTLN